MSVLGRLATALGRNDERPNVELAEAIAATGDSAAVTELVGALTAGTTAVQNDALKALYETAYRNPALVAPHVAAFIGLLSSRNNRNVWGALQAIETLTPTQPGPVLAALPAILAAADRGSVIAKDKAIGILCGLATAGHEAQALPVALDRLGAAAPNQFPMYAEQIAAVADAPARKTLVALIDRRLPGVASPAKVARLEKLLRKLAKSSSAEP